MTFVGGAQLALRSQRSKLPAVRRGVSLLALALAQRSVVGAPSTGAAIPAWWTRVEPASQTHVRRRRRPHRTNIPEPQPSHRPSQPTPDNTIDTPRHRRLRYLRRPGKQSAFTQSVCPRAGDRRAESAGNYLAVPTPSPLWPSLPRLETCAGVFFAPLALTNGS
jgi:hypothetical protein